MTLDQFNAFCRSMPHAHHVVQWGGAHVWKVGGAKGKVFAVCWPETDGMLVTFKVSQMSYDLLKDEPGMRPAPYFAARGMKWLQWFNAVTLDHAALKDYLSESHRLAGLNLTKVQRVTLGL